MEQPVLLRDPRLISPRMLPRAACPTWQISSIYPLREERIIRGQGEGEGEGAGAGADGELVQASSSGNILSPLLMAFVRFYSQGCMKGDLGNLSRLVTKRDATNGESYEPHILHCYSVSPFSFFTFSHKLCLSQCRGVFNLMLQVYFKFFKQMCCSRVVIAVTMVTRGRGFLASKVRVIISYRSPCFFQQRTK